MKWSFASMGLLAAGLVGVVIILLFQNLTINNEEDYYLLKEILEASMTESVDLAYYRDTGHLKIVQEKLVENFTRRFAESANILNTQNYSIEFYNIMEKPPKASVRIVTDIGEYTIYGNHLDPEEFAVANTLDGILEIDEIPEDIEKKDECYTTIYYTSQPYAGPGSGVYRQENGNGTAIKKPNLPGDWEAIDIRYLGVIATEEEMNYYNRDEWFVYQTGGWEVEETVDGSPLANYIMTDIVVDRLELFPAEGDGLPKFYWQATFNCSNPVDAYATNGTIQTVCPFGIQFEVQWYNKECKQQ